MSYYWFNRQELLEKAKNKYHSGGGKKKTTEYYQATKNVIKEKEKNNFRSLSEEEKKAKRQYLKNRYNKMKENTNIKMSEKTLKAGNIEINKKKFHASKQTIYFNLVDINKIVISDKFKHRDKGFKYFIGYKNDNIVRPLCIIFSQISGYVKYFENGGKICLI